MNQALYDLPEGWEWKKMSEISDVIGGGTPRSNNMDFYENGIIPWITPADLSGYKSVYISQGARNITELGLASSSAKLLPKDTVLFTSRAPIGYVAIAENPIATNQGFKSFVVHKEKILPKFVYWWLKGNKSLAESYASGTTFLEISSSKCKELPIPLPPLAEQIRIVEKLDAVLSRIDTAIDELQQSLVLVDAMFKSGLDEVFAGLALLYNATALSQVVKINSGIALPSIFKESHASGAIPFYKVAQMNNHTEIMTGSEILFSGEVSKAHKVTVFPKGSVLIPKRGGAILTNKKRILVEDASYDSNIMGLKANNQLISDEYLFAFMQSIDLSDFVDASTIPQINNKHIDQMMIPVPSLSEQKKAVRHINELTNHTTQLKTELTAKIGMFNQLKASVLDGAFRGEI